MPTVPVPLSALAVPVAGLRVYCAEAGGAGRSSSRQLEEDYREREDGQRAPRGDPQEDKGGTEGAAGIRGRYDGPPRRRLRPNEGEPLLLFPETTLLLFVAAEVWCRLPLAVPPSRVPRPAISRCCSSSAARSGSHGAPFLFLPASLLPCLVSSQILVALPISPRLFSLPFGGRKSASIKSSRARVAAG